MKTRAAFVLLLTLLCLSTATVVAAQDAGQFQDPDRNRTGFQFCTGKYALCAASTCTPTGNKINVNGSNIPFDEADCLCPVLDGVSVADVNGGTMKGDCKPPSADGVWSLYSLEHNIPQEITNWAPAETQFLKCSADLHQGREQVNCFSFACDNLTIINGATVATCHCAKGESPFAEHVPPPTAFVTEAGQGDPAFCFKHPVAGTLKQQ